MLQTMDSQIMKGHRLLIDGISTATEHGTPVGYHHLQLLILTATTPYAT